MASAGRAHTALLRSDGKVALTSAGIFGILEGDHYNQVSAGGNDTVLLSAAGKVRFVPPAAGLGFDTEATYSHVSTDTHIDAEEQYGGHFVLLKDDGKVIDKGIAQHIDKEEVSRALKDHDLTFVQVAAGTAHTVVLSKDGMAVAYGSNAEGQCNLSPSLEQTDSFCLRESCVHVSAGHAHTVLVTTEGEAIAIGRNAEGQCRIPSARIGGIRYTEASAGFDHTVLLASENQVFTAGSNRHGQCDIPYLPSNGRLRYLHVSAGCQHTVLIRSDGAAVCCGSNANGQCTDWLPPFGLQSWWHWLFTMPVLKPGITYVDAPPRPTICAAPVMNISIRHVWRHIPTGRILPWFEIFDDAIDLETLSMLRRCGICLNDEAAIDIEDFEGRLHIESRGLGGIKVCNNLNVPEDLTVADLMAMRPDEILGYKAVLPDKRLLANCPGDVLLLTCCGEECVRVPSGIPIRVVGDATQLTDPASLITILDLGVDRLTERQVEALAEETASSPLAQEAQQALHASRRARLARAGLEWAPPAARVPTAARVPQRLGGPGECEEPEGEELDEAPAPVSGGPTAPSWPGPSPRRQFEPLGGVGRHLGGWHLGEERAVCEEPETEDNL